MRSLRQLLTGSTRQTQGDGERRCCSVAHGHLQTMLRLLPIRWSSPAAQARGVRLLPGDAALLRGEGRVLYRIHGHRLCSGDQV